MSAVLNNPSKNHGSSIPVGAFGITRVFLLQNSLLALWMLTEGIFCSEANVSINFGHWVDLDIPLVYDQWTNLRIELHFDPVTYIGYYVNCELGLVSFVLMS